MKFMPANSTAPLSLTHEQVMEIIPHRPPMLMIDTVSELVPGEYVIASTWVDPARDVFKGHFPGDPVFPGIYTVEATAQAADLILMTKPSYAGKVPLFLGIDHVRFWKKVMPGDTLEIRAELLSERVEKAIATCKGSVYVDGTLVLESEVSIAMR